MSQRTKVVGARAPMIWLPVAVVALVVALLALGWFVILPGREAAQHYQAGVAFQEAGEWDAARAELMQAIAIDADYEDAQSRLSQVKNQLVQAETTATLAAIARAEASQAAAQMTATVQAGETAMIEARTASQAAASRTAEAQSRSATHATSEAQFQATATIRAEMTRDAQLAASATAEAAPGATAAALEQRYQRAMGLVNLGRWPEAQAELQGIFDVDPNYKDVQSLLGQANAETDRLTPTATPSRTPTLRPSPTPTASRTPTSQFTATPTPTATRTPTPRPPTATPTFTQTPTNSPTLIPTSSETPTQTPSRTNTPSPTNTPTPTLLPTTEPNTILENGDTWRVDGWALTVNNFTYKSLRDIRFVLKNETDRLVLLPEISGSEFRIVSDVEGGLNLLACYAPTNSYWRPQAYQNVQTE